MKAMSIRQEKITGALNTIGATWANTHEKINGVYTVDTGVSQLAFATFDEIELWIAYKGHPDFYRYRFEEVVAKPWMLNDNAFGFATISQRAWYKRLVAKVQLVPVAELPLQQQEELQAAEKIEEQVAEEKQLENIIHVTKCGMFRVVEKSGEFYPQERVVTCCEYSDARVETAAIEERLRARYGQMVHSSPFEGWFLGYTCRRESKGYKRYKSEKAAIKYVEQLSQELSAILIEEPVASPVSEEKRVRCGICKLYYVESAMCPSGVACQFCYDKQCSDYLKAALKAEAQKQANKEELVEADAWMMHPHQHQEVIQYKVLVDMCKVAPDDVQSIVEALLPGLAEPMFQGLRFLIARYNDRDTAYARSLDAECAAYCGRVEVEETRTFLCVKQTTESLPLQQQEELQAAEKIEEQGEEVPMPTYEIGQLLIITAGVHEGETCTYLKTQEKSPIAHVHLSNGDLYYVPLEALAPVQGQISAQIRKQVAHEILTAILGADIDTSFLEDEGLTIEVNAGEHAENSTDHSGGCSTLGQPQKGLQHSERQALYYVSVCQHCQHEGKRLTKRDAEIAASFAGMNGGTAVSCTGCASHNLKIEARY